MPVSESWFSVFNTTGCIGANDMPGTLSYYTDEDNDDDDWWVMVMIDDVDDADDNDDS